MIEYYNHYILPASPARSKLAIHLNAQTLAPTEEKSAVTAAVEKGMKILALSTDKDSLDGEVAPVKEDINHTTSYIITDVREFRSKLQISAGPQAVKRISEFEELDSKL
jgi:insulysin